MIRVTPDNIKAAIAEYDYPIFGLRVVEELPADGDVLETSFRWIDGEPTEERLNGTSVIGVTARNAIRALKLSEIYLGEYVVLVGADRWEQGEDAGEMVLRDPVVLERWKR